MGGVIHRQAKPERWAVLACRCGRSMVHSSLNFDPASSVALRFFVVFRASEERLCAASGQAHFLGSAVEVIQQKRVVFAHDFVELNVCAFLVG